MPPFRSRRRVTRGYRMFSSPLMQETFCFVACIPLVREPDEAIQGWGVKLSLILFRLSGLNRDDRRFQFTH